MHHTEHSVVQFQSTTPDDRREAFGSALVFTSVDCGHNVSRIQYIHRVHLTGLQPATEYVYRCGGPPPLAAWSTRFRFRTGTASSRAAVRLAIYGDMGVEGSYTLGRLLADTAAGLYDAIIHVGDIAYNMCEQAGRQGDEFMRQIEQMAATVPYMVCPGNHEEFG